MADLEDALKKLDRLTLEEARMANAEVLRITHGIRDGVADVGDKVQCVDDKVQVVIEGAQTLSSRLTKFITYMLSDGKQARVAAKEIGDKVSDVGVKIQDKVQCVDQKVQVVIDGARGLSGRLSSHSNIYAFRRQASKGSGEGHR